MLSHLSNWAAGIYYNNAYPISKSGRQPDSVRRGFRTLQYYGNKLISCNCFGFGKTRGTYSENDESDNKSIWTIIVTLSCSVYGSCPLNASCIILCDAMPKLILIQEGIIKKILWESRLWVSWRKEPILGYVPKNYKKRIHAFKD